MTGRQQPDVAGAVLALDQAMIALAVAKSTLLGETSSPVPLASLRDRGRYDAASAAEVAAGSECPRCASPAPAKHPALQADGGEVQPCPDPWHSPTLAHLAPPAGHQLRSISIPSGGAA